MISARIVALLLILSLGVSIKMTLFLNSEDGGTCFYQQLKQGQKYSVSVTTYSQSSCKLDIYKSNQGSWQTIVSKNIQKSFDTINKLSDSQSTYMICFVNSEQSIQKVTVEIMAGLELANFQHLPDQSDKEQIDQMVNWMQTLKNKLLETINRQEGTHRQTVNLKSSSSKTMLILAIIALLFIVGNNVFFYLNAKKQLQDRKLI